MSKDKEENCATDFIKVRSRLRTLANNAETQHQQLQKEFPQEFCEKVGNFRVELYLDETGRADEKQFTIGGIYIVGSEDAWKQYIGFPYQDTDKDIWEKFLNRSNFNYILQSQLKSFREILHDWKKFMGGDCNTAPSEEIINEGKDILNRWNTFTKNKKDKKFIELFTKASEEIIDKGEDILNRWNIFTRDKKNGKFIEFFIKGPKYHNAWEDIASKWYHFDEAFNELDEKHIEKIWLNAWEAAWTDEIEEQVENKGTPRGKEQCIKENVTRPVSLKCLKEIRQNQNFSIYAVRLTVKDDSKSPNDTIGTLEQCTETVSEHRKVLHKLVELFLHVILPMWEEKNNCLTKKINYGTVTRECISQEVAEEIKDQCGYNYSSRFRKILIYTIDTNTITHIKKYTGYVNYPYDLVATQGFSNKDFSKLHHIADAVVSDGMDQFAQLYKFPGMEEEMDNLEPFTDANKHFYENKPIEALSAILNDSTWEAVETIFKSQSDNTARLYICERLGREAYQKISEAPKNKFYALIDKVREQNKNQTNVTPTSYSQLPDPALPKKQNVKPPSKVPNHNKTSASGPSNNQMPKSQSFPQKDQNDYEKGWEFFEKGEYKKALEQYETANKDNNFGKKQFQSCIEGVKILIPPKRFGVYIQICRCNLQLGKYKQADNAYNSADRLMPKNAELRQQLKPLRAIVKKKVGS